VPPSVHRACICCCCSLLWEVRTSYDPLDCAGIVHAHLPDMWSLTAHIVCMANTNAGKLCHSLLQNCSLHTLCFPCASVVFEQIHNLVFLGLCAELSQWQHHAVCSCSYGITAHHCMHHPTAHHPTCMTVKRCCFVM